ncbi:FAD-dependent oxidoreductase [Sphingomonas aurantiaca]|uniref:FAD-dependent oxidoreductase n=1 Tax=Sphingomonas aurantiaca TaxID=185949 RepID=UPI002FE3E60D
MTDTKVLNGTGVVFEMTFPAIVIGAGATGLTAALALRDKGSEVLVLERDSTPWGPRRCRPGSSPLPARLSSARRKSTTARRCSRRI